jgi:hypothetical protein
VEQESPLLATCDNWRGVVAIAAHAWWFLLTQRRSQVVAIVCECERDSCACLHRKCFGSCVSG